MPRYRRPHRIKKKKSIFRSKYFWLALLFLLTVGAVFYFAIFTSTFQVKEIKISGNQKIPASVLENLAEEKVKKRLFFFTTRSIFLINPGEIVKALSREFPQIASLKVRRKMPAAISLEIQERAAVGIFCQNENCFFIDGKGIIFEKSSSDLELIIRSENIKDNLSLRERVIEENILKSILEIQKKLEVNFKIVVKQFLVGEERINVKAAGGWEIYFDPSKDINWQLTKLGLVLEKQIPPERRKDLEYIELRFGNIAPYKYRGSAVPEH